MCNSANCSHDDLNDGLSDIFGELPGDTDASAFAKAAPAL